MTNSTERSVYLKTSLIIAFLAQSALAITPSLDMPLRKKCNLSHQMFSTGGWTSGHETKINDV